MWGKNNDDDYMGKCEYDDGKNNTRLKKQINNSSKNQIKSWIPFVIIVLIGTVIYNVGMEIDKKDKSSKNIPTAVDQVVNNNYQEVDSYLDKLEEFSTEGFNFIDEVIFIYEDNDYSVERIEKLKKWALKLELYDFTSYSSAKYSSGNTYVSLLKGYIKEALEMTTTSGVAGIDYYDKLEAVIIKYDNVDIGYLNIVTDLLEESGIRHEKTEDGGIDYWAY